MKNKWKIIVPIVIIVVLAVAFLYGGDAPGIRDKDSDNRQEVALDEGKQSEALQGLSELPELPELTELTELTENSGQSEQANTEESEQANSEVSNSDNNLAGATKGSVSAGSNANAEKDKYNTDPIPEGKPKPVEPQDAVISDEAYTCRISISCATILDNMSQLAEEKVPLVPEDGWILTEKQVTFYEGESVFNVLQRVCKQEKIHMEFSNTPIYNSAYIEGINNLYEFDCGELSGWMYNVNEWFPNYGCSRYMLKDGDIIKWVYSCDLGEDVGGRNVL